MTQSTCAYRVQKDLKELLNMSSKELLITATPVEDRLDHISALVMGPPDTPYHCGFFVLDLRFPANYPNEPPKVRFMTTDSGRLRFNPNLYADGKVCLSILGTWRGETTEVWRCAYSVGYVLNAIQSMIMVCDPYHNEPGFERDTLLEGGGGAALPVAAPAPASTGSSPGQGTQPQPSPSTPSGSTPQLPTSPTGTPTTSTLPQPRRQRYTPEQVDHECAEYNAKITHETMRVAVCDAVEAIMSRSRVCDYTPFAGDVKKEFYARYETYVDVCQKNLARDGTQFTRSGFEYPCNVCEGSYNYKSILARLERLREALSSETQMWRTKGKELTQKMSYSASTLRDECARIKQELPMVSGGPVDDSNVFVWNVSFIQPEGLYEEGMYSVEIVFPPEGMRAELPRVTFLQPIFHPSISPSGIPAITLSYDKRENVRYLLEAIMDLLTKSPCPSPAVWVNKEAADMCFSRDPEQQKLFKRRARQLARQSAE